MPAFPIPFVIPSEVFVREAKNSGKGTGSAAAIWPHIFVIPSEVFVREAKNSRGGHGFIACPDLAEALSVVEGEVEGCRLCPITRVIPSEAGRFVHGTPGEEQPGRARLQPCRFCLTPECHPERSRIIRLRMIPRSRGICILHHGRWLEINREGHEFTRADDGAMDSGFSRWGKRAKATLSG